MNKEIIRQKEESVSELLTVVKKAKSYLLFEYQGLSAYDIQALRKQMTKSKGKIVVAKNTIIQRALEANHNSSLTSLLAGPNAVAFGMEDEIAPFKLIAEAAKTKKFLKIKGGYLDGKHIDAHAAQVLASIPGRDGLYTMIASMLQSPIRSFAVAVKAIAEKQATATAA